MKVKLVKQEPGTSICGHCCVAMISNVELDKVIELFGHQHSTRTKEVHNVLKKLGIKSNDKLTRKKSSNNFPDSCILKITYDWRKNNGHWIYYKDNNCYDPVGYIYNLNMFDDPAMGRITSFLKIYS